MYGDCRSYDGDVPLRNPETFNLNSSMQQEARAFAIKAHADQQYGARPYSYHLDQVAALAQPYGEEAVAIAYLHDTVEDTHVTTGEIESRFGTRIAACVALLTDEDGSNRKERKEKTYKKLAAVSGPNEIALLVKAADRLANVRACVKDRNQKLWLLYQSEQTTFRAAAFRPGQCDALWSELDILLTQGAFDAEA
jgi:(p)ppGpp synthase/HD superfamily hydrolase